MEKVTVKDIDLKGKRVLIRVDFNVPLNEKLEITDDIRIKASLPTIKYVLDKGGIPILMSHLGRPDGKVVEKARLTPVANRLSSLLGKKVIKLDDCIGPVVKSAVAQAKPGDIILLENLRFHPEEEKNDPNFAKELAGLGDVFVNDAFGTAHRAHASTEGITKFLPSVAGFLIEKELQFLGGLLSNPKRPFAAILGGAKVSDKISLINNIIDKVDIIIVGGGMCYTFLKAKGISIGSSKLEQDKIDLAKSILENSANKKVEIVLPCDHIIADKFDANANTKVTSDANIPDGWMGLDIGPKTVELFKSKLKNSKTILWNGPLGVFEMKPFAGGSKKIAEYISTLGATTVIGGGDTASAVSQFGLQSKMSHISTGGGASLEFLEGKVLPGIAALKGK